MQPKAIKIHLNTKSHEIIVSFDSLLVSNLQIPSGKVQECTELLEYFREKRYLINLTSSQSGAISFTYATGQIKELLTTAGKMLEIYTYHKIKELGKFDDVVSSFEIDWEETEVKSEFDCILTKGFKTLFVECMAKSNYDKSQIEFYYSIALYWEGNLTLCKEHIIKAKEFSDKIDAFLEKSEIDMFQEQVFKLVDSRLGVVKNEDIVNWLDYVKTFIGEGKDDIKDEI